MNSPCGTRILKTCQTLMRKAVALKGQRFLYSVNQKEINPQPHTWEGISGMREMWIQCVKCADEYIKQDLTEEKQLCRNANGKYSSGPKYYLYLLWSHTKLGLRSWKKKRKKVHFM